MWKKEPQKRIFLYLMQRGWLNQKILFMKINWKHQLSVIVSKNRRIWKISKNEVSNFAFLTSNSDSPYQNYHRCSVVSDIYFSQ